MHDSSARAQRRAATIITKLCRKTAIQIAIFNESPLGKYLKGADERRLTENGDAEGSS